jgi:hypothetical protein
MFSRKADGQPAVIVPTPEQDRPSWVKIGVIAAVGFGLGILWPRVAGLRLAPSAPESAAPEAPSSAAATASAASLAPTVPASNASQAASSAPTQPAAPASPVVTVGHGFAYACKTVEGESLRGSSCGGLPALDTMAQPRLKKLAQCAGAQASVGKLHLVLHADFERGSLLVNSGKGSTIAAPEAALLCARHEFEGAQLAGIRHAHKRYSVAYTVTFAPPSTAVAPEHPASAAGDTAAAASSPTEAPAKDAGSGGGAEVVWEVGIVRDAPKTGHIVARLPRGTKIKLGPPKDGWYPIKYGADFGSDGFLYRGAIGK